MLIKVMLLHPCATCVNLSLDEDPPVTILLFPKRRRFISYDRTLATVENLYTQTPVESCLLTGHNTHKLTHSCFLFIGDCADLSFVPVIRRRTIGAFILAVFLKTCHIFSHEGDYFVL